MADGGIGNQSPATLFQARLKTDLSGVSNTLTLNQYQGNKVVVSGLTVVIPLIGLTRDIADNLIDAAGADAGAPGAADTLYYVYISNQKATFSPSAIRLSATAPSLVNGVKYLGASGNALNWRFVGWVKLNATPQFESSDTSRLIINYYNRLALSMFVNPGYVDDNAATLYPTASGTWVTLASVVGGGAISRLNFISNGEDSVKYEGTYVVLPGSGNQAAGAIGEDSVTQAACMCQSQIVGVAAINTLPVGKVTLFSEGDHFLDMLIAQAGAGINFYADNGRAFGDAADEPATMLSAIVQG